MRFDEKAAVGYVVFVLIALAVAIFFALTW